MLKVIKCLKSTAAILLLTVILLLTLCAFSVASDATSNPAHQYLIAAKDDGSEPFGGGE